MIVESFKGDIQEWNEFVIDSPEGTFFHTVTWKEIIEKSFNYESLYLTIRDQKRKLVGICPFFITKDIWPFIVIDSLPKSDLGGPIIKNGYKTEASKALKDYLNYIGMRTSYVKIKVSDVELCNSLTSKYSKIDASNGTMILDLHKKSLDYIWSNVFNQKQRKYIKRFENDGIITRDADCKDDFDKFCQLYRKNMKEKHAPFNYNFYMSMFSELSPKNFNIQLIERNDSCIGAGMNIIFPEKECLYMIGVGIDKEVSSRYKIYYKLRWETLKNCNQKGIRYVSFGPTSTDNNSIYNSIKSSFGADLRQDFVLYIPVNKNMCRLRDVSINVGKSIKNILPKSFIMYINNRI